MTLSYYQVSLDMIDLSLIFSHPITMTLFLSVQLGHDQSLPLFFFFLFFAPSHLISCPSKPYLPIPFLFLFLGEEGGKGGRISISISQYLCMYVCV